MPDHLPKIPHVNQLAAHRALELKPVAICGDGFSHKAWSVVNLDNLASARIHENCPIVDHDIAVSDVGHFMKLDRVWQRPRRHRQRATTPQQRP